MHVPADPPIVTQPPSPSPPPSLTPAIPAAQYASWTLLDLPDPAPELRGAFPVGVVKVGDRLIALGTVTYSCCTGSEPRKHRGVVWTSRAGTSWRLHDPIASLAHATIEDLVYDGTRLIAVGRFAGPGTVDPEWQGDAATWTSTDGLTWTRSSGLAPTLIASGPHGFIGAVTDRDDGTVQFVTSDDGLTWTVTSNPIPVEVRNLAVDGSGHALALGIVPGEPGPDGEPFDDTVVIGSRDGRTWFSPEVFAAHAYPPYGFRSLIGDEQGFVASVTDWVTGEDQLWRITVDDAARLPLVTPIDEEPWDLVPGGDVLILTRHSGGDRVVWVSLDGGTSWGRVASGPALDRTVEGLRGAVVIDDRLIVVGWRSGEEPFHVVPIAWYADR